MRVRLGIAEADFALKGGREGKGKPGREGGEDGVERALLRRRRLSRLGRTAVRVRLSLAPRLSVVVRHSGGRVWASVGLNNGPRRIEFGFVSE